MVTAKEFFKLCYRILKLTIQDLILGLLKSIPFVIQPTGNFYLWSRNRKEINTFSRVFKKILHQRSVVILNYDFK